MSSVTFEHPLNERIRAFMRLEHLFGRFTRFAADSNPWSSRVAIETLIEIASMTARADIKNDLVKELERASATLKLLVNRPGVDPETLLRVLDDLAQACCTLQEIRGPIGQCVREDEFLQAIAQRISIPGGSCSFDLPQFHHWLQQPHESRKAQMMHWLGDLSPTDRALRLLLSLIRTSTQPRQVIATRGFFQETLEADAGTQLLRIQLDNLDGLYPEVSGHKNRFSINFLSTKTDGHPAQVQEEIGFRLSCCAL